MNEEYKPEVERAVEAAAIDLDTDPSQELDAAMQEALDAIEHGRHEEDGDSGDGGPDGSVAAADPATEGVEALRAEAERQRQHALRALADMENFRKRTQRERQVEARFRAFDPMKDLLSVVDNLERAVASAGSVDDLKQGVSMILRQVESLLGDYGVARVEALGESFDPSVHEAVSREEDGKVANPTVVAELQAGYKMHDRLLRPSVVKVAMPAAEGGSGDPNDGEGQA